ncbi:MAG: hypothetical protein HY909_30995 [Deltaproteobacteria bacterium]|nr:hypothetical protein [Deltaproteobacteria bacterium]
MATTLLRRVLGSLTALAMACSSDDPMAPAPEPTITERACALADPTMAPDFVREVPCTRDFDALASAPLDAAIPGARSVKVVYDRSDGQLYFQHSTRFQIHYSFATRHLSGGGRPLVPPLAQFNASEYFSPDRRFILGAVTHYEGPGVWALELSPYDTASAAMITTLYQSVQQASFFGPALSFHPTSDAVATEAARLPSTVRRITTDQLYARTDYQPLTLGTAVGRLRFSTAAALATTYLSHEDIVVLDQAPNDISVVRGLITQTFQTPLSHVNVLSQNRRTPNMGLRGAVSNARLRALDGRLVELTVGPLQWTVREATQAEADAFTAAHRPAPVTLPAMDLTVTGLVDIENVTPEPTAGQTLRDVLRTAVRAFGGKAAHYSILTRTPGVPIRDAFVIPIYYYDLFMRTNGLYDRMDALLAEDRFRNDPAYREARLGEFRAAMLQGTVDQGLQDLLRAKIAAEYPNGKIRFRTSTNSEDLDGFPCAGCYESHSGDPRTWTDVLDAIRETWASAWLFRTFEERTYYGIAHRTVGMALLCHHNFPDEEANGVAITANIFDDSGLDPAFYVNVQSGGDVEVVAPPPGVTSDQFLYFFSQPNQPVAYLARSSLVPRGQTVLSPAQVRELGLALDAIHQRFSAAYGPASGNRGWYAMDVEFKFDDDGVAGRAPRLYIKQARPYPGRGRQGS